MIKITNNSNLPESLVRFTESNRHFSGGAGFSVTELLDSPQIRSLKKIHAEDLSEDVSDSVMSIIGTAVHEVLSRYCDVGSIPETRLFANVSGETISGQIDLLEKSNPVYEGFIVVDYKTTSAATITYNPEGKKEWEQQLNLYAFLAEENGIKVSGLDAVVIIRDWSKKHYKERANYPSSPILRIPMPFWTKSEALDFIKSRIELHKLEPVPECTDEDRWARPSKYAVYGKPHSWRKPRAKRVFNTKAEAEEYEILLDSSDTRIEERTSGLVRCENNYCGVAKFCNQFKEALNWDS